MDDGAAASPAPQELGGGRPPPASPSPSPLSPARKYMHYGKPVAHFAHVQGVREGRVKWSAEEVDALRRGVEQFPDGRRKASARGAGGCLGGTDGLAPEDGGGE